MTAPRASVLPQGWTRRRLRFDCLSNPVKSKLDIPDDTEVSFVPMDAVGELGGLRLDQTRELADVYNGYTYFADGDVCIAKITPCFENGKGAIAEGLVNGVAFGTTELHVLRPSATLDTRFLFYLTIAHDFRSHGEAEMLGASGQKRVPEEFLKDWTPSLPRMDVQQRIARFLDDKTARIDALIEKKQELLERLEEKRQALITRAVTKGLNPDLPMKPSGVDWLGYVPRHWEVKTLRRHVQRIEQGWSPQTERRMAEPDEWGVLKSGCVNLGIYDENEQKALPGTLDPKPELEVRANDVLMCRASGSMQYIGSVALVERTRTKLMFSDKTYRISLSSANTDREYFVRMMSAKHLREQIRLSVSGAEGLANNIPQSNVLEYLHAFPPLLEQVQIADFLRESIGDLDEAEGKIRASSESWRAYRLALVTAAVTGQLPELNG
ncbi:restriction endonuclease subunit S [Xanthomonas campestris pv. campestris]|jgi:type I restriction enzyme S subunit|uniref:Type I site-specific deoxyribonuclease (Specificity subunit) n=3 Tax=Xanthomonas campestris TaxID=339 RepID=B0RYC3_XANCB|nr:restriction endonuclease subunit S [Xanthomonas campestris]AAY50225.1 putative restriction endonuclease S subunits [Xanthomonas campestris pv. campestris str. 8004]MBD8246228.1 restriction endonuclease subunit S [Xanthomonas campestris]MCF8820657.1 restriction endonuclease subunit S [Xanthomonas campestris pv. campestris]MCF8830196.1 restriction endonuclease subunit S [Xanthomonas campestris pv. campestris]MCF8833060.1 restriction endonuclease subunit S [Xanthomonas campestris pv. campestri